MRILHICLSCFYIDNFSYQENELVRQGVKDGHLVEVIASTETFGENGLLRYTEPGRYLGNDGAMVERLPYLSLLPHFVAKKLRMHSGVYDRIASFQPDVIMFHGASGWEIRTAARYVRNNPNVKLYLDSHEDAVNSARNWVSKWILHYCYYRPILRSSLDMITKVLAVSISCIDFLRDFYGIPLDKIEFYPLGGSIPDDDNYVAVRNSLRAELGLNDRQVLIIQSGKIDKSKKLVEALEAFSKVTDVNLRFFVVGLIQSDVDKCVAVLAAKDPRVRLLGWKAVDELRALLCAADVYCQPGPQSATMQMSVSCRCAIILDDIPSHRPYLQNNGWLIGPDYCLTKAFNAISCEKPKLLDMKNASHKIAKKMLDYRNLAARLYN